MLIDLTKSDYTGGTQESENYCCLLEQGNVIFFDHLPFDLPEADIRFLLSARQDNTRLHKNISYRPEHNVLRGFSGKREKDFERLREIMQNYSEQVVRFLSNFLAPYAENWSLDYASFRPIEESGRALPLHKRNELLHVDAFPSRPTWGGRILRFFNNINPTRNRVWEIGESFDRLAGEFAFDAGLGRVQKQASSSAWQAFWSAGQMLGKLGVPIPDRSPYDRFMLRFHDYLKENASYQKESFKKRIEFPPNSTWIVFTDCVPHSVLSGQFALEQTFIIPFESLVAPEDSPIRVLENMCGQSLI